MTPRFTDFLRGFSDVVFPPTCVHCRALVESEDNDDGESTADVGAVSPPAPLSATGFRHLCPRCVTLLDFVQPPHCTTCGHPFYGVIEGERRCVKCEGLDPAF